MITYLQKRRTGMGNTGTGDSGIRNSGIGRSGAGTAGLSRRRLAILGSVLMLGATPSAPVAADDKFGRAFKQQQRVERETARAVKREEERLEEERIASEPVAPFVVTVTKARTPDERDRSYTNSIQEAVNRVAYGGKIVIEPGDYRENIYINNAVTLVGLRGENKVRIFPASAAQSCLTMQAGENQHAFISNIEFYVDKYMAPSVQDASIAAPLSGEEQYDNFLSGGRLSNTTTQSIDRSKPSIPCIDVRSGVLTMTQSRIAGIWEDRDGSLNSHQGSMVQISGGSATLQDNEISGGRYGVSVEHHDAVLSPTLLIDNHITDNDWFGINLAGRATMRATGNTIMGNGNGILYDGEGTATILANKVMHNGRDGIVLGSEDIGYSRAREALVQLNRIYENHGTGVRIFGSGGAIEDNFLNRNGIDKNGKFSRNKKQIEYQPGINGVIPRIENNWINNKKPRNWR